MAKTFAMIKPDAVQENKVGAILFTIESAGFKIMYMRMELLRLKTVEQLYREHKGRPYYDQLVRFTLQYPVVLLCLGDTQPDTVARFRRLMGATDPRKAEKGSLRHRFGKGIPDNAIHGSDGNDSAQRELLLFFPEFFS